MKLHRLILPFSLLLSVCALGCTSTAPDAKQENSPAQSSKTEDPHATAALPDMGDKKADEPTSPPVSEDKQKEAAKLADEAEKVMLDPKLQPKEKYPQSLQMFRDALKIDPNNSKAKENIQLLEDIYKSMGLPIPKAK